MQDRKQIWFISYGIIAFVYVLAIAFSWEGAQYGLKPLLMIVLGIAFYQGSAGLYAPFRYLLSVGLGFSMMGDTLLMFSDRDALYFLLGLGSFLCTHLCYLTGFARYPSDRQGLLRQKPWLALPALVFLAAMLWYLWPDLPGPMRIPVSVYCAVIVSMALSCLNRSNIFPAEATRLLLSGIVLFIISDSLIALNKFKGDSLAIPAAHLIIIITYVLGQYLIVRGAIRLKT